MVKKFTKVATFFSNQTHPFALEVDESILPLFKNVDEDVDDIKRLRRALVFCWFCCCFWLFDVADDEDADEDEEATEEDVDDGGEHVIPPLIDDEVFKELLDCCCCEPLSETPFVVARLNGSGFINWFELRNRSCGHWAIGFGSATLDDEGSWVPTRACVDKLPGVEWLVGGSRTALMLELLLYCAWAFVSICMMSTCLLLFSLFTLLDEDVNEMSWLNDNWFVAIDEDIGIEMGVTKFEWDDSDVNGDDTFSETKPIFILDFSRLFRRSLALSVKLE